MALEAAAENGGEVIKTLGGGMILLLELSFFPNGGI